MSDQLSAEQHVTQSSNREFWRPEFNIFKKLLPKGKVIDIGCGSGRDALLFNADPKYDYAGIDLSEEMLEEAKRLVPDANFQRMNVYNLTFLNENFDGFWAATSLLHIPKPNIDSVLAEIHRIVRPDGIGFISLKEGEGESMFGHDTGYERFFVLYSEEEFRRILVRNSFEVLASHVGSRPTTGDTQWITYMVRVIYK